MNPLIWARVALVALLVGLTGYVAKGVYTHIETAGAATCQSLRSQDAAAAADQRAALVAGAAASQAAIQKASDAKDQKYVALTEQLARTRADSAVIVGRLRDQIGLVAAAAASAASSPNDSCGPQDRQIVAGAGLLQRSLDAASRGRDLVQQIGAQLKSLQEQCQ